MTQLPQLKDAILELEDGVATITFNRHDLRNALTGSHLIDDIVAVTEWVNLDQAVSVLVMTGAGSAFSAGGNIRDMAERGGDFAGDPAECAESYRKGIQRIPLALHGVEVPVIAAVNGPALGGGNELVLACSHVIAAQHAEFGQPEINLNLLPGYGGTQRLTGSFLTHRV